MYRIVGIVLVVVGIVLLGFAYNAAQAPLDQISSTLTGRFTSQTMLYGIVGIAAALGGVLLLVSGRRGLRLIAGRVPAGPSGLWLAKSAGHGTGC